MNALHCHCSIQRTSINLTNTISIALVLINMMMLGDYDELVSTSRWALNLTEFLGSWISCESRRIHLLTGMLQ
jgi:hypothetical protein